MSLWNFAKSVLDEPNTDSLSNMHQLDANEIEKLRMELRIEKTNARNLSMVRSCLTTNSSQRFLFFLPLSLSLEKALDEEQLKRKNEVAALKG
jgi:hypothetical protein